MVNLNILFFQKCHLVTFYGKRRKYLLHRKNHCVQFIDELSGKEIIWTHPCKEPQMRRGVLIKHILHIIFIILQIWPAIISLCTCAVIVTACQQIAGTA